MIAQDNSKKEPLAASVPVVTTAPKLIRVVAPTNLPGGYQMEVQTDNDPPITFTATVPMSGVKAGDIFLTPPPMGYSPPTPEIEAPIGRWRNGLCDCFKYGICSAQLFMAFCFTEVSIGQLLQRFRLTWLGGLTPSFTRVTAFKTVLTVYICFFVYDLALGTYLTDNYVVGQEVQSTTWEAVYFMKSIVGWSFFAWSVYALCMTRKHVRETYSIPEQNCVGCEDCVCSTFCTCCTVVQIASHTADPEVYPSFCCTETGLSDSAPIVV